MSIDERIADRVSVLCSARSSNAHEYDLCVRAVSAALADPTIRGEIENAAYERAAKIADEGMLVPPDGGSPTDEEIEVAQSIAAAIRALKK